MDTENIMTTIPIVRDYLDVFPDELPSMPLEREIEFSIDLLPVTLPISKAPYRMGHAELKELDHQLLDCDILMLIGAPMSKKAYKSNINISQCKFTSHIYIQNTIF